MPDRPTTETPAEPDVAYANTDRELWREGDPKSSMSYYEPSIHVTEQGEIGINVGGMVYVRTLREWHALASAALSATPPCEHDVVQEHGTSEGYCIKCGAGPLACRCTPYVEGGVTYHASSCPLAAASSAAETPALGCEKCGHGLISDRVPTEAMFDHARRLSRERGWADVRPAAAETPSQQDALRTLVTMAPDFDHAYNGEWDGYDGSGIHPYTPGDPNGCRWCAALDAAALAAATDTTTNERDEELERLRSAAEFAGMPAWLRLWNEKEAEEARARSYREALQDFAMHGTRYDTNPTVMWPNSEINAWWVKRAQDMDESVRSRARAALEQTDEQWIPCAECGNRKQEINVKGGRVLCTDCYRAAK